ncbi:MAG: hypothetical protein KGJ57_17625 [Sphingomonadales bacterium]|nr:hypothetical protein [Sphingomonadales bacterium]MDE2171219.1 hypothetical protein [Sphingomonadales bacterium]
MIEPILLPGGQSPKGRAAPVTEILGIGALPPAVERARALSALTDLASGMNDLAHFAMAVGTKAGGGALDSAIPRIVMGLLDLFDIERARASQGTGDAYAAKQMAIDGMMAALRQFREDWPRG